MVLSYIESAAALWAWVLSEGKSEFFYLFAKFDFCVTFCFLGLKTSQTYGKMTLSFVGTFKDIVERDGGPRGAFYCLTH